jgi:hypothetical protein
VAKQLFAASVAGVAKQMGLKDLCLNLKSIFPLSFTKAMSLRVSVST